MFVHVQWFNKEKLTDKYNVFLRNPNDFHILIYDKFPRNRNQKE